jgi:16S rRNA (guanine527-N7)-methyltransferase
LFHVKHSEEDEKLWSQFEEKSERLGVKFNSEQLEQLDDYYLNLLEWNKSVNLTAITELSGVLIKHFLDSLSIVKCIPAAVFERGISVIDVGTGAGFPGLVLAICFPRSEFTLLDSLNKRILFLDDTVEKLSIKNVVTVHGRAEDIAREAKYREKFDLSCSRAVADLSVLAEYDIPFAKVGGHFCAYKTEKAEEEQVNAKSAIMAMGGKIERIENFDIDDESGNVYKRSLVLIRKFKTTPGKYPRKAGTPSKEPILGTQ